MNQGVYRCSHGHYVCKKDPLRYLITLLGYLFSRTDTINYRSIDRSINILAVDLGLNFSELKIRIFSSS